MGSSVVTRNKKPPRLALKIAAGDRTRIVALDATARQTRRGRANVVRSLRDQTIIRSAILQAFDDFEW